MRFAVAWLCATLGFVAQTLQASAEQVCTSNTLGVSRTVEIDTTGGPWFGTPRGDPAFLASGRAALGKIRLAPACCSTTQEIIVKPNTEDTGLAPYHRYLASRRVRTFQQLEPMRSTFHSGPFEFGQRSR